jgi:hypothetical protein
VSSYTVTRASGGNVFTLYRGRLRHRAAETFDHAEPPEGVVTFTEHGTDVPRKVVAQKGPASVWADGRCPCECRVHGKAACGCPCPRHPYTTGLK